MYSILVITYNICMNVAFHITQVSSQYTDPSTNLGDQFICLLAVAQLKAGSSVVWMLPYKS